MTVGRGGPLPQKKEKKEPQIKKKQNNKCKENQVHQTDSRAVSLKESGVVWGRACSLLAAYFLSRGKWYFPSLHLGKADEPISSSMKRWFECVAVLYSRLGDSFVSLHVAGVRFQED